MLSDRIRQMRRHLDEYRGSTVELSPEGVEGYLMMLRHFEVEARSLEERLSAVSSLGLHEPFLPANVVPFQRPS